MVCYIQLKTAFRTEKPIVAVCMIMTLVIITGRNYSHKVKGKGHLISGHEGPRRGVEV